MKKELSIIKDLMWIVIPLYFIVACKENETYGRRNEIATLNGMRLSPLMDSLFKEYIKVFPREHAYAICIDKKSEGMSDFSIHIAPFNKKISNLYEAGATSYLLINDTIPVFIYTGLEDFVVCDSSAYITARDFSHERNLGGEFSDCDPVNRNIDFSRSWVYVRVGHKAYIVKGDILPFCKLTLLPTTRYYQPANDSSLIK